MAKNKKKVSDSDKEKELKMYKKGFELLMEYFDSISDEEQRIVDKKLRKLGL